MGQDISKETNSQSTSIIHHLYRCFRKRIAVSHLSVLLPVRMEQSVSVFKTFLEIFFCQLPFKFVDIFKCYLKSDVKQTFYVKIFPILILARFWFS